MLFRWSLSSHCTIDLKKKKKNRIKGKSLKERIRILVKVLGVSIEYRINWKHFYEIKNAILFVKYFLKNNIGNHSRNIFIFNLADHHIIIILCLYSFFYESLTIFSSLYIAVHNYYQHNTVYSPTCLPTNSVIFLRI